MIIELFGPPGAGKTTFARALAARLRKRGHTVDLILSHRPAECSSSDPSSQSDFQDQQISSVIRRLARPLAEILIMARHPFALAHDVKAALHLMKIMRPSHTLWSLRFAQYLSRLSRGWFQASDKDHIVIFDQAFVQAVCSLALLCGAADDLVILRALDETPKSDLLVLLCAPAEVVEARLRDRQQRESRLERLLEMDLATSLESLPIVNRLHELLRRNGRQVTSVASLDQHSLREAVNRVEREVAKLFKRKRSAAATRNSNRSKSLHANRLMTATQSLVKEN